MKMINYFPHDYNARNDPKLQEVLMEHGLTGIGLYWCIVEMLYEQGGRMPIKNVKSIAFSLHTDITTINSLLHDYELFAMEDGMISSMSIDRRLSVREKISNKRKKAIETRWKNYREKQMNNKSNTSESQNDTNVLQAEYTSNTIKIKENKEKENKSKIKENIPPIGGVGENDKNKFFTDTIKIEKTCMNLYITPEQYKQFAQTIINDWEITDETDWSWRHFNNVLRVKVEAKRNSYKYNNQSSNDDNKRKREQQALQVMNDILNS